MDRSDKHSRRRPDQHWSSPIILGLLAGGGACLIGGVALPAGARPRLRRRQHDATIIGVGLLEKPCIAYPLAENGQHVGDGCFCHLEVRSLASEATLRACRARLIKVETLANKVWIVDGRFTGAIRLKWAHAAPGDPHAEAADIEPDMPRLLDVVKTDSRFPGRAFFVTVERGPIGIPMELGSGMYKLTVRVSADGTPAADYTFGLSVMDNWNHIILGSWVTQM